uniref:Sulfatase modifying factor 2 n=1 Tax=Neogobius melanostomus TaxID=47308 RepID=A0A8C6TMZ1_9GOBI
TTVPSSTFNSILSTVFASSIFSNVAAAEDEMIEVPGGTWLMGTSAADGRDGESPVRQVKVESFQMDKYPVTNEDFREFVRATKYSLILLFVFPSAPWWLPTWRAFWRQPAGPASGIKERMDFPVVHVGLTRGATSSKAKGPTCGRLVFIFDVL